jgi:hypothetical protein
MQITYQPSSPYDTMMPNDLKEAERTLPAMSNSVLAANLAWMVEHEEEDQEYYGQRIKDLSERLGC